jgi:hypothetical protein
VDDSELRVFNTGDAVLTFSFGFTEMTMNADGILAPVTNGTYNRAADFLWYSPRSTVLAPGEAQTIRLLLRSRAPRGEYRSHLAIRFAQMPAGVTEYTVTVPVIIRSGQLDSAVSVSANLSRLPHETSRFAAKMLIRRVGDTSVFGTVQYSLLLPSGEKRLLAEKPGVAVYTERTERVIELLLDLGGAEVESGSHIIASFTDLITGVTTSVLVPLTGKGSRIGWRDSKGRGI